MKLNTNNTMTTPPPSLNQQIIKFLGTVRRNRLSILQLEVLTGVIVQSGEPVGKVARLLGISKSKAESAVRGLANAGYVSLECVEFDERVYVTYTKKGMDALNEFKQLAIKS